MSNQPFISIIVPVFNSQQSLYRCLDSLVYQTFENIEIIVINNGSTDYSEKIISKYVNEFPNKVKLITTTHFDRAGHGRNVGIRSAIGEYILFVDSDDMLHYKCTERIYEKAINNTYEMIVFGYYQIIDNHKFARRDINLTEPVEKRALYLQGSTFIWNKCIKRKILNEVEGMPENISFEDLAYTLVMNSNVNHIGVVNEPLYFFYQMENSETQTALNEKNLELIDSFKWGIEHMNPREKEFGYLFFRVFLARIKDKFYYADKYIEFLKEIWDKCPINIPEYRELSKQFQNYINLPDTPMEKNIFINGFGEVISKEYLNMIREKAFWDGCNIIVMNNITCDINENDLVYEAYLQKNYQFVGEYFAIKKIWEMGGIYLNKNIVIDAPMNYLRYFPCCFSFLNEMSFSELIFAGMKGNAVFKAILNTYYKGMYDNNFCGLRERITNILTALYDIPLNGKSNLFQYEAAVFSPDVFLIDLKGDISSLNPVLHMTHVNFSENAKEDNYITAPRTSIDFLVQLYSNSIRNDNVHLRKDRDRKRKERDRAREENDRIRKRERVTISKNKKLETQINSIEKERNRLSMENDRLSDENQILFHEKCIQQKALQKQTFHLNNEISEKNILKQRLYEMENSKSWRYTAFFRKLIWAMKKKH